MTTVSLSGAAGLAGWYRSPVTVTLTASDGEAGSGVSAFQYRLNSGFLQNYATPFTISAQGTTRVTAQAIDVAGNVEVPAPPTSIMIDTVAPVVAIASPQAREYLYNHMLTLSISASDSTSGLAGPATLTLDGALFTGSTIDMSTRRTGRTHPGRIRGRPCWKRLRGDRDLPRRDRCSIR